ncbi:MAG: 4Fe-4S binding protein [Bacillota bacterium]|nr:4Fe-4S binding protein [Bacillota bacterium]NLV70579.1 4Fe-4S binding protein [Clostridiales bacterium]
MDIRYIRAVYYSANGTTRKVVRTVAAEVARCLDLPWNETDFTLPKARKKPLVFRPEEFILFGTWVSAGRIPNLLLPYLEKTKGNGAKAVPLILYGGRCYEDALIELRDLLVRSGALAVAAAAFVGEHSFSSWIGTGRPDEKDLAAAKEFGRRIAAIARNEPLPAPVQVPGIPYPHGGYYQPVNEQGDPVRFLKAVPFTSSECIDCKHCAQICPTGAIDCEDVSAVTGKCIKCCACIRQCPVGAKQFTDLGFLSHVRMLERTLTHRSEPELFFAETQSNLSRFFPT